MYLTIGDLNVGHQDLDIHNPHAKHIVKQAGLTPQERESFTVTLSTTSTTHSNTTTRVSGYFDAFRYLYPTARGGFSYWSQRAMNRPVNKGIRLDYFICSNDFISNIKAYDSTSNNSNNSKKNKKDVDSNKTVIEEVVQAQLQSKNTAITIPSTVAHVDFEQLPSSTVPTLVDSYMLPNDTIGSSDHCPIVLVIKV